MNIDDTFQGRVMELEPLLRQARIPYERRKNNYAPEEGQDLLLVNGLEKNQIVLEWVVAESQFGVSLFVNGVARSINAPDEIFPTIEATIERVLTLYNHPTLPE